MADRWTLTAAGRDVYTPGIDALIQTHPKAHQVTLGDVATDGSVVRVDGSEVQVDSMRRAAIARLRTSRQLAGCLPGEPINGIFASEPGVNSRRR